MAEKPRGKIVYELIIVVLIVGLFATIIYPSRIWRKEEALQNICRARMETLHALELHYLGKEKTFTTDVLDVKEKVLTEPRVVTALDSIINWDKLVAKDHLKNIFFEKEFPEDLKQLIIEKLLDRQPLRNLSVWDSLEYRFVAQLQDALRSTEEEDNKVFDEAIIWKDLVGEDVFWRILNNPDISSTVRRRTVTAVRRGADLYNVRDWRYYRPLFHEKLIELITTAQCVDIWQKDQDEEWEKARKISWESEMDTLSLIERDSLWTNMQRRMWDSEKELIWKKDRSKMWKQEGATWQEENTNIWNRILIQQWSSERKKTWEEEILDEEKIEFYKSSLDTMVLAEGIEEADSQQPEMKEEDLIHEAQKFFRAKKDSLWRTIADSVQVLEYDKWIRKNKKRVREVIYDLWTSDRRVSWEEEAYEKWLTGRQEDKEKLWIDIKEDIWNSEKGRLWREEESKLARKHGALKRLDYAIKWVDILGEDRVRNILDNLHLPGNQALWSDILKNQTEKESALYKLGLVELFRNTLLDSLGRCPVAHAPHIIQVEDTTEIKRISIACPIVIAPDGRYAMIIESATQDTIHKAIGMKLLQKIFGGASIENHGMIDEEMKKSWEKRR